MDLKETALKAVQDRNPDGTKFKVMNVTTDFLDGTLVFVEFRDSGDEDENYVYVTPSETLVMLDYEDVTALVARYRPPNAWQRLVRELFHVGGVAGTIGILITLTICYRIAFQGVGDVPQVLSGALTTILGFYFGTKASK